MARLASVVLLLTTGLLLAPPQASAQIASPTNAGQNAGNSATPSSPTTFSVPNFSRAVQTPLVEGLEVAIDGSLEGSSGLIQELEQDLDEFFEDFIINLDLAADFRMRASGPLVAAAGDIPLATAVSGNGSVVVRDNLIQVSIAGELVDLPTTPVNQRALRSFAEQAINSGFTPASLRLGAQLVGIGAPVDSTLELMSSLQGLAAQPNLNMLARGIAAFNAIVNGASPALRAKLDTSPVFIAVGNVLRSTREALPPQR
jgi:hypothetical protein